MAFRWKKGRTKLRHLIKTASTKMTKGDIVVLSSGKITPAISTNTKFVGVIDEDVKSTDADYASTTTKAVRVPCDPNVEWEADVTGSLATTSVGAAFDLSNARTVNKAGSTYDVVTCKRYKSTSKGIFTINAIEDGQDPTWE